MNKYIVAYENKRLNSRRHKQSYVDYIAFLIPKIWEIPDVRLSPELKYMLARKEIIFIKKDIREVKSKIALLKKRLVYLQERFAKGILFKEEKNELSKITASIRNQTLWIQELENFKSVLEVNFPLQNTP